MTARTLMVVGTSSGAGKSTLVAALCRILVRDGLRVAPFKAQNIALNAGVTPDGHEIGRATLVQAEAARIAPHPDMNPVLLKPEGARGSQVVLDGRAHGRIDAENWQALRPLLWRTITAALDRLRARTDVVVIEGTGSPVELNLARDDMANLSVARYADAPVLLVGDIERGGVFAALVGTLVLLPPEDRARIRGLIINKLRGDPALLGNALDLLRPHAFDLPTLGVIPYLPEIGLPAEDVASLPASPATAPHGELVQIAIVRLPHIANFDDFEPLAAEAGVAVRYVERASELDDPPAAVIVPGSKVTLEDLAWLGRTGIAAAITRLARAGTAVVGICGGYQMLGRWLADPEGVEAAPGAEAAGLDLLPVRTVFERGKRTLRVEATVRALAGPFAALAGTTIRGYELHMGQSSALPDAPGLSPLCSARDSGPDDADDGLGVIDAGGRIWGTYLHGIFDNDDLRHAWLRSLGWQARGRRLDREAAQDRLADHVAAHLDMAAVRRIIGLVDP
ncbi:MAG TPA: cobyric acid synthase [Kofleriaceae bacterium]